MNYRNIEISTLSTSSTYEAEFLEMLESHKGIVFKVANTYARNHEDQEDLVQEIILQLWKSDSKYDSKYARSTWIYRISLNVAISFLRKQKSREKARTFDIRPIDNQDEREVQVERIKLLYQFIDGLKPLDKAIILLYLEESSIKEMAEIIGISESNVTTRIHRIKQKLKGNFKPHQ